jgi:hypothetical protein
MAHHYLFFCVCLAVGCGDAGSTLTGGSGGGGTGGGGTGGDPLLRMEVEDFSDFASFRYSAYNAGPGCPAGERTLEAEINERADGMLEFSYRRIVLGDVSTDECLPDLEWFDCFIIEESAAPRELTALESNQVRGQFSEVRFTGPTEDFWCPPPDPCDAVFEWDDTWHTDSPCALLSVSTKSADAVRVMLEMLRLGG